MHRVGWSLIGVLLVSLACKSGEPRADGKAEEQKSSQSEQAEPADEANASAGQATPGTWVGAIELPGDASLEWAIAIRSAADGDGTFESRLWIPVQMVNDVPVGAPVVAADGAMKVSLAAVGATWTITPGATATCSFEQRGVSLPCTIRSTDEAAFEAFTDPPKRPQTPEPPFPYAIEQLEIPNPAAEGVRLAATLTIPAGVGPHPAVVLISGSGLQDRDETIAGHKPFWVLADHLSRNGVAVLRYDDRGAGESTGDGAKATLEDFASDAWAAASFVAARSEIDGSRVGLIGHSEGGVIAPLVATQHPDDIDSLVLLAGTGVPGRDIIVHQLGLILTASGAGPEDVAAQQAEARKLHDAVLAQGPEATPAVLEPLLAESMKELPEAERAAAIEAQIATLNSPWFRHFLSWDPAPILAQLKIPVLVLFGEKDLQVDPEQNLAPMREALAGNAGAEFVVLPGLNHLFQPASKGTLDEYAVIETTFDASALAEIGRFVRAQQ